MIQRISRISAALICLALVSGLASANPFERGEEPGFTKTVSTMPGVCSNDSEITVDAGTTVYFCYRLDAIPVPYIYNLNDDVLGFIGSGFVPANQVLTEFAMDSVFVETRNIGELFAQASNATDGRGGTETFLANATVFISNGSGGFDYDAAIPTLSEWSMFLFGGLLLIAATLVLRRTSA